MNIYLTSGTYDYLLKKYENNLATETMLLMQLIGDERAILLHESNEGTLFNEPRGFEVIETNGNLINNGYVTMNHIPVNSEQKPLFEHKTKASLNNFKKPIFRFLRPLKGDTYIIFCQWESRKEYLTWKSLPQNQQTPLLSSTEQSWNSSQHAMFNGKPYVLELSIPEQE